MTIGRTPYILGLLLLLLVAPLTATGQMELTPHAHSRFWIQGEATTNDFTCVVTHVDGSARVRAPEDTIRPVSNGPEDVESKTEVHVQVPVSAFDCGNPRMTRDLQETLNMESHPEIRFELSEATVSAPSDTTQWSPVEVLGPLTISGTERLVRIDAHARPLGDGYYRVQGCLPVKMTYFGIDPPTKLLGLIKVKNQIQVQFDLIAEVTSNGPSSPLTVDPRTNPPPCNE